MQSKLILAFAAGALAIRDISGSFPVKFARALDVRDENACMAAASAHATLTADFPEVPTDLATATDVSIPEITDPCVFPEITGSAGQVITSYSSALQSWADKHITEISSIYAACSDTPLFSELVGPFEGAICSTALAGITGGSAAATASATTTATSTASATATVTEAATETGAEEATGTAAEGAASTTASFNTAPRETGVLVAAAAAAAGIVGAMML
ncbi:hypothetical protein C8034_v010986 [Colletotrichum sidae]|uniref:Infection structure specific protein n=1 Tax=Colletotrichum sidae TaxID=1347389 RepID=A0A4V3I4I0_9PEZI|nr:hypothetical protein C8034_v010986 [Colletotrichum sidae]